MSNSLERAASLTPLLLTIDQAARILAFKPATLRDARFRRRHGLRVVRFGRCLRFKAEDVEGWINGTKEPGR